MNKITGIPIAILLASIIVPLASHPVAADQNSHMPRIMTYNIYQGTELVDVITATTPTQFVIGAATDYGHAVANNFPERAQTIAAEIGATGPDLVGLQEVALWRTGVHTTPPTPATAVTFDYLQILLDALSAKSLHYSVLVVRNNFDVQGPAAFPTGIIDLRLTDRSAILVRSSDLNLEGLSFTNVQQHDYVTNTILPTIGGLVTLLGGWESVDISVFGFTVSRFVSTHLDGFSQLVRNAQAQELLMGPLNTRIPEVMMSGDLNSLPSSASYNAFVTAGFTDSWTHVNPTNPGYSCCQVFQSGGIVDIINNPVSTLIERVDHVLIRGPVQANSAFLVGADPSTRTPSGLWPSDHAGLVVALGPAENDS